MPLLEDKIEPLMRAIAKFLVATGASAGSSWGGYGGGDLRPLHRTEDDQVDFVRNDGGSWQARIRAEDVKEQEPKPETIKIHPEIVLSSKHKYGATIIIDNYNSGSKSGPKTFSVSFKDGEAEAESVSASMKNEVWAINKQTAKAEAGVAGAKAEATAESEQGFRNTLEAAWERQTSRTREQDTEFSSEEFAPPYTKIEQRLQWDEQTKQRRVECVATVDFKIVIGRRQKAKGKWRWASGSPRVWDSIEHLIAVAEKRGSVDHACYHHYSRRPMSSYERGLLEEIKRLRTIHVDHLTQPYSGNANIRVQIMDVATNEEKLHDDDD